jgi:hypothetical protein
VPEFGIMPRVLDLIWWLVFLLAVVLLWKEPVVVLEVIGASPFNKAWGPCVIHLLDPIPPTSPVGRGGEGRGCGGGNLGCGPCRRQGLCCIDKRNHSGPWTTTDLCRSSTCSKSSSAGDESRPPSLCPCLCWSTKTIFNFNLQIWRPFFNSRMASIVSLTPCSLLPGGEVAGGRSGARLIGGDRGPDRIFVNLFRVLHAYF